MNISKLYVCCAIILLALILNGTAFAQNPMGTSRVLAVVPVKGSVDQSVYRRFDRLVPELKKIARDNIIKLECSYSGRPENEQDVINAYQVAGRIEKYLRVKHNLELDLWITIQLGTRKTKSSSLLTIALFADDIKRLDSIPIDPKKTEEH
ncbi:MAG: hypothetical protein A2X82_11870 [Geobacteraceae bacterium GWC2_55_20]|nr:MAG: hypothetical protein A2X82_11870 [Geobacteraceae bacterium GWC2_55_20]OGU26227.1 MAG: hypothetical protein A2X85_00700 [Geobacteraceae bacterium GWF2_54_21]HBA73299.1 hypothetical protein [Geobacter sp.]HCE68220.1 hypothetical protein [Geobacter sp.]